MNIEDGYVVVRIGEPTTPLVRVLRGDQYQYSGATEWKIYPEYSVGAAFTGTKGFNIRRPIADCSLRLLDMAGFTTGDEFAHFI